MGKRLRDLLNRVVAWSAAWLFAAALYLLLIDLTDLPELIVGAVAAALAATGFELAREQHIFDARFRIALLRRVYRPVTKVPHDIAVVCLTAVEQLARRDRARGEFRSVSFRIGDDEERAVGRGALAESLGSFAPNTIVIGVDPDRELLLAHQLRRSGGREGVDVLELG